MSRSRKKTPIHGITTAKSTKGYKKQRAGEERAAERKLLHAAKATMTTALDDDAVSSDVTAELSHEQAPWNEWDCERDGKVWFDPKKHPKMMRK